MTTPPEPPEQGPIPDPAHPPAAAQAQPADGQPQYAQPQYGQSQFAQPGFTPEDQPAFGVSAGAPYGVDPATGIPYSDKSRIVAGILQLLVGWTGAGRWYTGSYGIAVAQLLTCGGLGVWALVDGILMLVGNIKDPMGRPLRP